MLGEVPEKNFVLLVFHATCPVVEVEQGQGVTFFEKEVQEKSQKKRVGTPRNGRMKMRGRLMIVRVKPVIPEERFNPGQIC